MADFDEAQAQSELDSFMSELAEAVKKIVGNLDESEPKELDESTVDEILSEAERIYGSPGNTAKTSSDLSASNSIATLNNIQGKKFTVTAIGPVRDLSGKAKVWGTLNGKQAYVASNLPFGFYAVGTSDTKSRCAFVSTTRYPEFKKGAGLGTWS